MRRAFGPTTQPAEECRAESTPFLCQQPVVKVDCKRERAILRQIEAQNRSFTTGY